MFIAVINENFDVAEESKRSRQASHYWASHRPQQVRSTWVRKLNPYRWFKAQPKAIEVELPSNLVLPMQKALVQDYGLPKRENSFVVCALSAANYRLTLSMVCRIQRHGAAVRKNSTPRSLP
jgi:voltage-dependent calcium channel